MSYGLTAFLIQERHALIFGSKNEKLLADVLEARNDMTDRAPTTRTTTTASPTRRR